MASLEMGGLAGAQLPIGWMGDRVERRRLAVALGFVKVGGALLWPTVISHPWIVHPVPFVWGGCSSAFAR
jgi:hypothetical protein